MEDLASFFSSMQPGQQQMLLAEQLRQRQRAGQQERLAAAMKGDPRMRMVTLAAMLSGNKAAADATSFMQKSTEAGNAPTALGNTGFFNPSSAEFVPSPMYEDEKAAGREQRRWERELAAETSRNNTLDRIGIQEKIAEQNDQFRRDQLASREREAAESRALRETLASLAGGNRRETQDLRQELADENALRHARDMADRDYDQALSARGNKPLSGPLDKSIRELTAQADIMGELLRDSRPEFFSQGLSSSAPVMEAKMLAARTLGDAAPQDMKDLNAFWARFKRSVDMLVRHENFGSALTAMEQKFWREVAVSPGLGYEKGMDLLRKLKIDTERTVQDAAGVARANRVNPEAVDAATRGRFPASPKPVRPGPEGYLPPDRAERLRARGVLPPSPTGSVAPNRTPPPVEQPQPATATPDGWKIEVER